MIPVDMCTSCCLLKEYLGAIHELTSITCNCISGPWIGSRDSEIPAATRGIACVGKTNSTSSGPLAVGDGVVGISSPLSLGSRMEVRERFSGSIVPKTPSRVSIREAVLHPARVILIFPKPSHFNLATFSSR